MSLATNIVRRGSRYYVRLTVPLALRSLVGKRQVWESLKTSDPAQARARAPIVEDRLRRSWDAMANPKGIEAVDIEDAIWERYSALIEADEKFRYQLPTDGDLDEIWRILEAEYGEHDLAAYRIFESFRDEFEIERQRRSKRLATLKDHTSRGETDSVSEVLGRVLARGLQPKGGQDVKRLAQGLQRAEIEALTRAAERDTGDFSGLPKDAIVRPPVIKRAPVVLQSETIMGVYDKFARERAGSVSADTWSQNRMVIELLADYVGKDQHVSSLTRRVVRDWKALLFKWPVKAAETKAFRGLNFKEVIAANTSLGKPTISDRTINRYLSAVGSFSRFLLANDFVSDDIMRGMFLSLDKSVQKVFPYEPDQLKAIFGSPLFASCQGDGKEHKPGNVEIRDWRYWIPWIALYSGARLGEIAQLHVADVRQIHGRWCFHISEVGGGKKVKTAGSERVVPVHPELVRIGLLDYHKAMAGQGETKLFPTIKADTRGFVSGAASSFFNDYLRHIGVKADKSQNFHSFRHGIADAFRHAGFMDEQFGVLLGHVKASTTQRYGIVPEGDLKMRAAMIDAVKFAV